MTGDDSGRAGSGESTWFGEYRRKPPALRAEVSTCESLLGFPGRLVVTPKRGLLGLLRIGYWRAGVGGGGQQPSLIALSGAADVGSQGLPEIGHTGSRAIGGLERDGADHLDLRLASGHGFGQVGNGVGPGLANGDAKGLGSCGQFFPAHAIKQGGGDGGL